MVISQPFVEGRDSTSEEIADYLMGKGFRRTEEGRWVHPVTRLVVWDTAAGNAITSPDGKVHPIDLVIEPAGARELKEVQEASGINSSDGQARWNSPAANSRNPSSRKDRELRFSLAPANAAPGQLTKTQVEGAIRAIAGSLGAIGRNVTVVQSEAYLPSHYREQIAARNATGRVNGFFDPVSGKIYIVADAHRNGAEAVRTLLHEAVGEYGIDRVLPARDWAQIRRSLLGHPLAREVSQTYAGTRDIGSLTPEQQDQVARETLSKMAEDPSSGGGKFSRVIPLLKAALRRMGIKYAYSHADLMHIVGRARETVARESTVQVEGKGNLRFSLQDQVEGNADPASANSNTAQQTTLEGGSRQITGASPAQAGKVEIVNEPRRNDSAADQSPLDSEKEQTSGEETEGNGAYAPLGAWRDVTGGARNLVRAAVQVARPFEREIAKAKAELEVLRNNLRAKHEKEKLTLKLRKLKTEAIEAARNAIRIPENERGDRRVKLPKNANGSSNWDWQELGVIPILGAEIVEDYTHPDLLPEIKAVHVLPEGTRAGHTKGEIFLPPNVPLDVVAHEITHATEQQTQEILLAARAFREKRRINNELPQFLSKLTGDHSYDKRFEMAYEDSWREKGGNSYSGLVWKDREYMKHATEILTTGIQRLRRGLVAICSPGSRVLFFRCEYTAKMVALGKVELLCLR